MLANGPAETLFNGGHNAEHVEKRSVGLIKLPRKRQTATIFREFILGKHEILFYLKSSPASKWYLRLRQNWRDHRITGGGRSNRDATFATSRLSRRKPFAFGSKQFYAAIICSVIRAQCSKASNRNTV